MNINQLDSKLRAKIAPYFRPDNGSSEVDEIEIDEANNVIAIGHRCTKTDCNCVGGWWEKTGKHPIGNTLIVKSN